MQRYPDTIEPLLEFFGYSNFINHFSFIPMVIIGSIGFIGNAMTAILSRGLAKKFPLVALYRYLVFMSIASSFNCFMFVFNFLPFSMRSFPWLMSRVSVLFSIHVYTASTNICYFYNTVLSILILLDRVFVLRGKKPIIPINRIYQACLITFLIILVMDIPYYLNFEMGSFQVPLVSSNGTLNTNESLTFRFLNLTPFATSPIGKLFLIM